MQNVLDFQPIFVDIHHSRELSWIHNLSVKFDKFQHGFKSKTGWYIKNSGLELFARQCLQRKQINAPSEQFAKLLCFEKIN